jgi:hypothetical protein
MRQYSFDEIETMRRQIREIMEIRINYHSLAPDRITLSEVEGELRTAILASVDPAEVAEAHAKAKATDDRDV